MTALPASKLLAILPATDLAGRQYAFRLLVVYVISGLGLLLTTSLLGLRRYLRQRQVQMSTDMAGAWLITGGVMIAVLVVACALLPRPAAEYAVSSLPLSFAAPDGLRRGRISPGSRGPDDLPDARLPLDADLLQQDVARVPQQLVVVHRLGQAEANPRRGRRWPPAMSLRRTAPALSACAGAAAPYQRLEPDEAATLPGFFAVSTGMALQVLHRLLQLEVVLRAEFVALRRRAFGSRLGLRISGCGVARRLGGSRGTLLLLEVARQVGLAALQAAEAALRGVGHLQVGLDALVE